MNYRFDPEASVEFRDAARYYEGCKSGLGEKFTSEVQKTISRVLENPLKWRAVEEDVRQAVVKIFPYYILFTVEENFILVVAVAHVRRRPLYWKDRLKPD